MSVRFAPSPTGKLHIGNLRTAWISHAFARALNMEWVLRFEDIDRPRCIEGSIEQQLGDLKKLGLMPDLITIQSERHRRHELLFREAVRSGKVYPCTCSRKEIQQELQAMASAPHGEHSTAIYNGKCRPLGGKKAEAKNTGEKHAPLAWRFCNTEEDARGKAFGEQDFIIGRTDATQGDFQPAYQWACAIDDFDEGHRLLVRAFDLAHVVSAQRQIQKWLNALESADRESPAVFHAALVTSNDGHRLEKRTCGVTLQEILQSDVTLEEIRSRFEKSFDSHLIGNFRQSLIWGEPSNQLTLREIGF
jgi:glutamyl-tRNA synthetase